MYLKYHLGNNLYKEFLQLMKVMQVLHFDLLPELGLLQVKKVLDDKVKSADYQSSALPNKPYYSSWV